MSPAPPACWVRSAGGLSPGMAWVGELVASLDQYPGVGQDAVHGPLRGEIGAFVEQGGDGLGRGQVGEQGRVQHGTDGLAFNVRQGRGGRGPAHRGRWWGRGPGYGAGTAFTGRFPAPGRPGSRQGRARPCRRRPSGRALLVVAGRVERDPRATGDFSLDLDDPLGLRQAAARPTGPCAVADPPRPGPGQRDLGPRLRARASQCASLALAAPVDQVGSTAARGAATRRSGPARCRRRPRAGWRACRRTALRRRRRLAFSGISGSGGLGMLQVKFHVVRGGVIVTVMSWECSLSPSSVIDGVECLSSCGREGFIGGRPTVSPDIERSVRTPPNIARRIGSCMRSGPVIVASSGSLAPDRGWWGSHSLTPPRGRDSTARPGRPADRTGRGKDTSFLARSAARGARARCIRRWAGTAPHPWLTPEDGGLPSALLTSEARVDSQADMPPRSSSQHPSR